jgi:hypothetical protein
MSPALRQFAKVLLLFFMQGSLLWGGSFVAADEHASWVFTFCFGVAGAVICWWAIWLGFHAERTWQPWLETLALMAATFWTPVFCDGFVRSDEHGGDSFFPIEGLFYLLLALSVPTVLVLGLTLRLVRWLTRFSLSSTIESPPLRLLGLFALTALVAGHLMAFLPFVRNLKEVSDWPTSADWRFWLYAEGLAASTTAVVLGISAAIMGRNNVGRGIIGALLGWIALLVTIMWQQPIAQQLVPFAVGTVGIVVEAVIIAFGLRTLGYRLGRAKQTPSLQPLQSARNAAAESDTLPAPTTGGGIAE